MTLLLVEPQIATPKPNYDEIRGENALGLDCLKSDTRNTDHPRRRDGKIVLYEQEGASKAHIEIRLRITLKSKKLAITYSLNHESN